MTTETITKPEPLSLYELHSPAEQRIYAMKVAAYRDVVREEEAAARRKQESAQAATDAPLNEDDYFALAVKRQQEQQAKEAARQAAEQAKKDDEAAYLASLPDVAEVCEGTEFLFLVKCQHWMAQGYTVAEDSVSYFVHGCYSVRLHKPTTIKRSK